MGQIGFSTTVGSAAGADEEDVVAITVALGFDSAMAIWRRLYSLSLDLESKLGKNYLVRSGV